MEVLSPGGRLSKESPGKRSQFGDMSTKKEKIRNEDVFLRQS